MKFAQVIALYKKGARHDPNNYRPISLLSIFDKIFEKILCKRLISFLERNRILYCHQYGFRKFYSTYYDTFLFTNDRNIDAVKEKASILFEKNFRWCVANQLSINREKTNFVLFHAKNKPISENFDCIQTTFITLNRVKCVQYFGLMIDENLYWHMHVEHVYNSLVKYFGIFNHV